MIIRIDQLSFSYPEKAVLHNLCAEIPQGITVLLGPNASGKSTLIKCLAGWCRPEGVISLNGDNLNALSREQKNDLIGYLPQQEFQRVSFSVFETVLLGRARRLAWRPSASDLEAVHRVLRETGLEEIAARRVDQLSGGQQKMVAIAQALIREPHILLLDEPVNSLDYEHQLALFVLLRDLTRTRKMNTVVALHDLNLAAAFADQILVLKEGRIRIQGTARQVITREIVEEVYRIRVDIVHHGESNVVVPLIPDGVC